MTKKYRVTLTPEEHEELGRLLARGKADVRCLKHAHILLKADEAESGPSWSDERIAEAFAVGIATVERVRQRFVEEGLQAALRPYRTGTRAQHPFDRQPLRGLPAPRGEALGRTAGDPPHAQTRLVAQPG